MTSGLKGRRRAHSATTLESGVVGDGYQWGRGEWEIMLVLGSRMFFIFSTVAAAHEESFTILHFFERLADGLIC